MFVRSSSLWHLQECLLRAKRMGYQIVATHLR